MNPPDFDSFLEQYHLALFEIINGNPGLCQALFSQGEDVTLANPFAPFGPVSRGYAQVAETIERAAANYTEGKVTGFEKISGHVGQEFAYIVEIERFEATLDGRQEMSAIALRVTSIFRREDGDWRVLHRHADPTTSERRADSLLPD